jgi:Heparinase II/III-like protein/Heparinase II/III N-terminus
VQSFTWYLNRLRTMSPAEVGWRVSSMMRDHADRWRVTRGTYPTAQDAGVARALLEPPPFRVTDVAVRDAAAAPILAPAHEERLVREADQLAAHRLSFFNVVDGHLGDPIDWNRDHGNGVPAPTGFAAAIDYRDYRVTGDAKMVWEPNRHHHLVVLGRAYRATGDCRYAQSVRDQLESWLDQCPYGTGMNWRSPLEQAIRLINWVWALDLVRESGVVDDALRARLLHAVYLHLWDVTRKFSQGSSANNHLIGEAAGVYVAASYFPALSHAAEWRAKSRAILCREIAAQTFADGLNCEHALGYQLFVIQFFLFAGIAGRRNGDDFPEEYWATLERMFEVVARLGEAGPLPMFGDADDGYVLNLGAGPGDVQALLGVGALLFNRRDFKTSSCLGEPAVWLFGADGCRRFSAMAAPEPRALESHAFPSAGYYLLQSGGPAPADRISVFFDCAELGFGAIAAHGHADALSVVVRAFGEEVLVDPGTYDYFTFPEWRRYFRGTSAHNTLVVDGCDQSVMSGPFMWGSRATARCLAWAPDADGGTAIGEHDGYRRLDDPVGHRRSVALDRGARTVTIRDDVDMRATHQLSFYFHLGERCEVVDQTAHSCAIAIGSHKVVIAFDESVRFEVRNGSRKPLAGWASRGYHRKSAITTLVASLTASGPMRLTTRLRFEPDAF